MNDKRTALLVSAAQVAALLFLAASAWIARSFLSSDELRAFVVLVLGAWLLFPVRYRWEKDPQKRYIRIPFVFVGFCELAIVIFDRFKPPPAAKDRPEKAGSEQEAGS